MEKLEIVSEQGTKTFTREELCKIGAKCVAHFFDDAHDGLSPDIIAIVNAALLMYSGSFIHELLKDTEEE